MIIWLIILIINDLQKEKERRIILLSFELLTRLELVTSSLPRKCSTTELQQPLTHLSGAKVENKIESTKKYALFLHFLHEKFAESKKSCTFALLLRNNAVVAQW